MDWRIIAALILLILGSIAFMVLYLISSGFF